MTTTTPDAAPAAVDLSHTPDPGGIAPASVTETAPDANPPAAGTPAAEIPPVFYLSQSGAPNDPPERSLPMLSPEQIAGIRDQLGNPEFPEADITPGLLADMAIVSADDRQQALSRAEAAESELAETRLELSRTIALSRDGGGMQTVDPALLAESASIASEKLDLALSRGMKREAVVMLKTDLLNGDKPNTLLLSRQPELGNVRVLDYLLKFAETAGCYTSPLAKPGEKTALQALSRNVPDPDGHSPEKEGGAGGTPVWKRMADNYNAKQPG